MANLVLGAAGAALGGPIGGTLGAMVGRQIDRSFARGVNARLSDLRAPSSQYGDPIPTILEHMRVAGVVLWASQPVATATVSKSGTSQGSSVSFAYGLSSARVESVGRIWADGRLIRDRDGKQAISFDVRLHNGDEDQLGDPLIASILGEAHAPAFRGIAYLLFEDLDLSTFGNRLPIITVEVDGTTGPIDVEGVLGKQLGLPTAQSDAAHELEGYALVGDDLASALSPLCSAFDPSFAFDEGGWALGKAPAHHLIDERLWTIEQAKQGSAGSGGRTDPPTKLSLRYFDPALDFAASEKAARLPGTERLKRIELPATMTGERAKAAAFEQLTKEGERSEQHWLRLPFSYFKISVGDTVSSGGAEDRRYTVCTKELQAGQLRLGLRRQMTSSVTFEVEIGSAPTATKLQREPLSLSMIEVPGEMFESEPAILVLVSGGHVPFQAMPLTIAVGGVEQVRTSAAAAASKGVLLNSLPFSSTEVLDKHHRLLVEFDNDPLLSSCDDTALLAGANLAWVDGEFIQFATAKALGEAKYEISDLVRGRFDTGGEGTHEPGSPFLLVNPSTSTMIKSTQESIGAPVAVRVYGPDNEIAEASLLIAGIAARPWAPAHLRAVDSASGIQITWVRRCKEAVPWLDDVGSPLGSNRETYEVRLSDMTGASLDLLSNEPAALIDRQMLDKLGPRPWTLTVRQLGDFAAGKNAHLTII